MGVNGVTPAQTALSARRLSPIWSELAGRVMDDYGYSEAERLIYQTALAFARDRVAPDNEVKWAAKSSEVAPAP